MLPPVRLYGSILEPAASGVGAVYSSAKPQLAINKNLPGWSGRAIRDGGSGRPADHGGRGADGRCRPPPEVPTNVLYGASRPVPVARGERLLSVQLRDPR